MQSRRCAAPAMWLLAALVTLVCCVGVCSAQWGEIPSGGDVASRLQLGSAPPPSPIPAALAAAAASSSPPTLEQMLWGAAPMPAQAQAQAAAASAGEQDPTAALLAGVAALLQQQAPQQQQQQAAPAMPAAMMQTGASAASSLAAAAPVPQQTASDVQPDFLNLYSPPPSSSRASAGGQTADASFLASESRSRSRGSSAYGFAVPPADRRLASAPKPVSDVDLFASIPRPSPAAAQGAVRGGVPQNRVLDLEATVAAAPNLQRRGRFKIPQVFFHRTALTRRPAPVEAAQGTDTVLMQRLATAGANPFDPASHIEHTAPKAKQMKRATAEKPSAPAASAASSPAAADDPVASLSDSLGLDSSHSSALLEAQAALSDADASMDLVRALRDRDTARKRAREEQLNRGKELPAAMAQAEAKADSEDPASDAAQMSLLQVSSSSESSMPELAPPPAAKFAPPTVTPTRNLRAMYSQIMKQHRELMLQP